MMSEGVPAAAARVAPTSSFPSFDSLNTDFLVNVLSHVSREEMNNIAFVNQAKLSRSKK